MKRYFLQLAHKLDPKKHTLSGSFLSEKYDGSRAFWDGGVTRGMLCDQVPWANLDKKGHLLKAPIATGLWSRYGNRIAAPDWFLDSLPESLLLDGELFAGRGRFQFSRSTVGKHTPVDEEWEQLVFNVLDAPAPSAVFADGEINEPNFKRNLRGCLSWYRERATNVIPNDRHMSFQATNSWLKAKLEQNDYCVLAPQDQLPFNTDKALEIIEARLAEIIDDRGEGVIIRKASSMWLPNRVHECLKYKPYDDAEGTVIGYTWGKETDKGSKLLGLMGNLVLNYNGKRLELSGFTHAERIMGYKAGGGADHAKEHGAAHAGQQVDPAFHNPLFPIGTVVTFRYREHSDTGIPKEARYFRKLS